MRTLIIIFTVFFSLPLCSAGIIWEDFFPMERPASSHNSSQIIKTSDCDFVTLVTQYPAPKSISTLRIILSKINDSGVLIWRKSMDLLKNIQEDWKDDTLCSQPNVVSLTVDFEYSLKLFESERGTLVVAIQYFDGGEYRLNQTELDFAGDIIKNTDLKLETMFDLRMFVWEKNILLVSHHTPVQVWQYSIDSLISNIRFDISLLDSFDCSNSISYNLLPQKSNFYLFKRMYNTKIYTSKIQKGIIDRNGKFEENAYYDIADVFTIRTLSDTSSRQMVIGKIDNKFNLVKLDKSSREVIPMELPFENFTAFSDYFNTNVNDIIISGYPIINSGKYGLNLYKYDTNGVKISSVEWLNRLEEMTFINGISKSCDDSSYVVISYLPEPYNSFYTAKIGLNAGEYSRPSEVANDCMIYPNPFIDRLNIDYAVYESSKVKIQIYNLIGRLVFSQPETEAIPGVHNTILDLHELANGYYTLILNINGKFLSHKLYKFN